MKHRAMQILLFAASVTPASCGEGTWTRRMACEGISAAEVVKFIGEPRRTAEMHFREATGRSIHDEIDEVRFAKVFRLKTGLSMRDWRKMG